jgi:intraflagellar transport protein 46
VTDTENDSFATPQASPAGANMRSHFSRADMDRQLMEQQQIEEEHENERRRIEAEEEEYAREEHNRRTNQALDIGQQAAPLYSDDDSGLDGTTNDPYSPDSLGSPLSGNPAPFSDGDDTQDPENQLLQQQQYEQQQYEQQQYEQQQYEQQQQQQQQPEEQQQQIQYSEENLYNQGLQPPMGGSADLADLFSHIDRYQPLNIELETRLAPFLPELMPAIGQIDAFVKVPAPDGSDSQLGLTVLDEPSANQSDPTVLDLQLRVVSKTASLQPMTVRSIEKADKNPQKITSWINNIQEVHRQKPPPTVSYSSPMPDVEQLMQAWPASFEDALKHIELPSADMNLSLEEYARIVCGLLDIPVRDGKLTESLHVLFTLFSEFKNHPHFQQVV